MRAPRALTAVIAAAFLAFLPNTAHAEQSYPDPQPVTGQQIIHDPTVIRLKSGGYVAYSTGGVIGARLSKDRKHWTDSGNAFAEPPSWWYEYNDTGDPWAPDISYRQGRYWLYYAVSSWGTNHSAIGVATSRSGLPGTWDDHGKVFTSETTDTWNAIDPALIQADGRLWMSFGSYWTGIRMVELNPVTGKAVPGATVHHLATRPDAPYAVEGPYIVKHGRHYYLFASYDQCCAGVNSTYKIRVGRSTSVTGPYTDSTGKPLLEGGGDLLLEGHGRYIGTGGQSVFRDRGQDWLAYHYYDAADEGTPKLGLNRLHWTKNGWPIVL
ncbi:arabinan endo-1,5-alpha-L-arabinosidase [Streptomyces viridochromogenes]|uniref:Arabinan endo-1,5-alpha-L-arabinosidase n=1 Tax=Streptomyces viridochromogenes TaxID=1938 RepID=A0A0J7ZEA2_STRVR|nr:arabinan endo-1,5-alpha-L-arabinosidase [Streptomyces viridochromogenes]KMS73508.1 arabinan endo-1,5-alpha-L-arabinosidase [Streptomyces viridochromogenes]KOG20724.1 arabinan endo-1,5-alpha-L-arabinosidase [Streptomyces viridochromogenes]KOG21501.1 arabinan endo-1,5-alpha-L-arabinosidase [Streptomyces viridochromogenes]